MQKQCNNYDCIQGSPSKYTCESEKKKIQYHGDVFFFFLFCLLHFKVNSVVSMPEKPNILEIRYIAVQYSKDVFIYLSRAGVFGLHLHSKKLRQRPEISVFACSFNIQLSETQNEKLIIYF